MRSSVCIGRMAHVRHTPRAHRFGYAVDMTLLDLDEIDTVFDGRWFWSTRRPAWARWRRDDYLGPVDRSLKQAVLERIRTETGVDGRGPVLMLTTLRRLGHSFNPVTFYWAMDPTGEVPVAFVAEITNTPWNERFAYAFAWDMGEEVGASRRFRFRKKFHVSPFFPMDLVYDWTVGPPSERIAIHMEDWSGSEKVFDADLAVRAEPISGSSLARSLLRSPMTSVKVLAAIYWQALVLKLKGVPFFAHPATSGAGSPSS